MSDGQRHIPDTPTGPAPPEHGRDAPDLPRRDAGEPADGNLVKDGQVRTDHPSTAEPQKGRSSHDEAGETAAAAVNGPLDEGAYRRFLAESDLDWASVEDLQARYGSFQFALAKAGIAPA